MLAPHPDPSSAAVGRLARDDREESPLARRHGVRERGFKDLMKARFLRVSLHDRERGR